MRAGLGSGISAVLALCPVSSAAAGAGGAKANQAKEHPAIEREDPVMRRVPEDVPAKIVFVTSETFHGREVGDSSPQRGA